MSGYPSDRRISRRGFIRCGTIGAAALCGGFVPAAAGSRPADLGPHARDAMYYERLEDRKIVCRLCPHECRVADLERGTCGVRENRAGSYYTLVYGNPCSLHVDPIEKKPLFHYYPGSKSLSLATAGCNFVCRFCQNWEISQKRPEQVRTVSLFPDEVVRRAARSGCRTVAHTYSEPVIFYEYMLACARRGRDRGVPSVMISNGYIQEKPMRELCRHLGAVKIDLKAFSDEFYQRWCSGTLQPVLDTLTVLKEEGVWFEIVVLIIPTLNDSPDEIRRMCDWIARNLGTHVPLHFSRYHPTFMMKNIPPTPPGILHRCRRVAREAGLKFVYIGNLLTDAANTFCPSCGKVLIERYGYLTALVGLERGRCRYCRETIPGRF